VTGPRETPAAQRYKDVIADLSTVADDLRERDRLRAAELARELVDLDAAMKRAGDRAAVSLFFAEVAWEDPAPVLYANLRYRLSALDVAGNESIPSAPLAARAYSSLPPDPPAAAAAAWIGVGEDRRVRVMWTARPGLAVLVERAAPGTTAWRTVGWSAPGVGFAEDVKQGQGTEGFGTGALGGGQAALGVAQQGVEISSAGQVSGGGVQPLFLEVEI